jgi:hypothetical protein
MLLTLFVSGLAQLALGSAVALAVVESFERGAIYEDLAVPGRPSVLSVALGAAWLASLTGFAGVAIAGAGRVLVTAQRASRS